MNSRQDACADPMGMLDAGTDYPDGPSQPSDGSRASGLISPNAQHQTFLSAPCRLRGVSVGPSPALQGATGDTGLARGPGLVSMDLAQFLDVPAIPEAAVCSILWQQARQCWGGVVPRESGTGLGYSWVRAATLLFLL